MRIMDIKEALKKDIMTAGSMEEIEKDSREQSLQIKARKLLVRFFAMILILTFLSKAADSVTIAQVVTVSPSGGTLAMEAFGTGTIISDAVKYIRLEEGLAIEKVHVKPGQKIKAGDILVTLDQEVLKKAVKAVEYNARKLQIDIRKEALSTEASALPTREEAANAYKNAGEDLGDAGEDLKEAKKNYATAVQDYKKTADRYDQALTQDRDAIYEEKTEEYKVSKNAYDTVRLSNEETLRKAERACREAKKSLDKLTGIDQEIMDALNRYEYHRGKDWSQAQDALEELYRMAYDNADSNYDNHKYDINVLETKLSSASKDLREAKTAYEEAVKAKGDLSELKKAVTDAEQSVEGAEDMLDSAKIKENNIQTAADLYTMENASSEKKEAALESLNKYLYGGTGYRTHKREIALAREKVSEAEEDRNAVLRSNELALEAALAKTEKIQKELSSIDEGTYDYKEAAAAEKQEMETADQEAKAVKQEIEKAKDALKGAKRAAETAKFKLKQAGKQDQQSAQTQAKQKETSALAQSALQLDLEQKLEMAEELQAIYKNKGRMVSKVSGTVDAITFQAGKLSTGDDTIAINTGDCGILAMVPKEEGEYVAIGDEMELTARGKKNKIKVTVESIRFTTDKDGVEQAEITGVMPKGEYIPGAEMDVQITKNTDMYDYCIPITALRQDSTGGYYVLKTESRNTVLGEELIATSVKVNKLEGNATEVAVEGSLSSEDNVIESSNKDIAEGDRVRKK